MEDEVDSGGGAARSAHAAGCDEARVELAARERVLSVQCDDWRREPTQRASGGKGARGQVLAQRLKEVDRRVGCRRPVGGENLSVNGRPFVESLRTRPWPHS